MKAETKEELLKLFSITLAIVACATLVFMSRTPSVTGLVTLQPGSAVTVAVVAVLILAAIAVVLGAIIAIHKISKELHQHKEVIGKTMLGTTDDIELVQYISNAREKGFTNAQIAERLQVLKWDSKKVKQYLK